MATFLVLGNSQPAHRSEIKQNGRVQNQQLTCLHIAWGIETLSSSDLIFQRALNNCYVIHYHFVLSQTDGKCRQYICCCWLTKPRQFLLPELLEIQRQNWQAVSLEMVKFELLVRDFKENLQFAGISIVFTLFLSSLPICFTYFLNFMWIKKL